MPVQEHKEPIFNLPALIVALSGLFVAVRVWQGFLDDRDGLIFLFTFAFVPARYAPPPGLIGEFPGGAGAEIWSFVSYAFLHGDWVHLIVNTVWMAAFGTAVLRRFGNGRFLLLSLLGALAGAGAHLATNWADVAPVVGASAAVSAHMGAAIRFAFVGRGVIGVRPETDPWAYVRPAPPLFIALMDRRAAAFTVVWFAINLIFAFNVLGFAGTNAPVAWEAHIGGFLAGLLLFPLLDPVPRHWSPPPVDLE